MLSLVFSRKADKFLVKVKRDLAKRVFAAVQLLLQNPFPHGVKRVENQWFEQEKIFRIRVGDYRVLYTVNYQKERVLIVDIDKRSRIYD